MTLDGEHQIGKRERAWIDSIPPKLGQSLSRNVDSCSCFQRFPMSPLTPKRSQFSTAHRPLSLSFAASCVVDVWSYEHWSVSELRHRITASTGHSCLLEYIQAVPHSSPPQRRQTGISTWVKCDRNVCNLENTICAEVVLEWLKCTMSDANSEWFKSVKKCENLF